MHKLAELAINAHRGVVRRKNFRTVAIAGAILLHSNSIFASEFLGDAHMQARDLLSGTVGGQAKAIDSLPKSDDSEQTPNIDPQDQARQLILGKKDFGNGSDRAMPLEEMNATPALSIQGNRRIDSDPQESARRMILGEAASGARPALKHTRQQIVGRESLQASTTGMVPT